MKIAIFMNEEGRMVNFYDCTGVTIYKKIEDDFEIAKIIQYEKVKVASPNQIRKAVKLLIEKTEDCDVAAFGSIAGIPYAVFDMAGFRIFQIEAFHKGVLKEMVKDLEDLEEENKKVKESVNPLLPKETKVAGVFVFDLSKAQEIDPNLSSKKALKSFLETTPFMEVQVICKHVPPWIEKEERYKLKVENAENGYIVIIRMA